MYKSAIIVAAAIAFATAAIAPASASAYSAGIARLPQSVAPQSDANPLVHKTGMKGKFAKGFVFGLGTAAVLGAGGYGYYGGYDESPRFMCRRWRRQCWNGNGNACWKFDNRC